MLGDLYFHTCGHHRCLGPEQGHRLPLHVGAHQGAVGIVMLQEGYQGGGDADYLLGRDVDVLYLIGGFQHIVVTQPGFNPLIDKLVLLVEAGVGLGDNILVLFIGGHVADLVGDEGDNLNLALWQLGQLGGYSVGDGRPGLDHRSALGVDHGFAGRPPHQFR